MYNILFEMETIIEFFFQVKKNSFLTNLDIFNIVVYVTKRTDNFFFNNFKNHNWIVLQNFKKIKQLLKFKVYINYVLKNNFEIICANLIIEIRIINEL